MIRLGSNTGWTVASSVRGVGVKGHGGREEAERHVFAYIKIHVCLCRGYFCKGVNATTQGTILLYVALCRLAQRVCAVLKWDQHELLASSV